MMMVLLSPKHHGSLQDVHLFNILSGPLHNELRTELNKLHGEKQKNQAAKKPCSNPQIEGVTRLT